MPSRHRGVRFALAASIACVIALAHGAAAEPRAAPAEQAEQRPDPNRRVCRDVKVTGSHMRQRVCFKQREWDRMRDDAQEALRKARPSYEDGNVPR